MDAITTGWGATRSRASSSSARRARRLARALAALERWADRAAEALAAEAAPARGQDWADGAQSGLADVAARLGELGRWLRAAAPGAPATELDVVLAGERAWSEAAHAEALAAAEGALDLERLHALGRAATLADAAEQLARLAYVARGGSGR